MTGPAAPPPGDEPAAPPGTVSSRPGVGIFTIEGRAAPGLFVLGWLAAIAGLVVIGIALLAGGGGSAGLLFVAGLVVLAVGLLAGAGGQAIERRARAASAYTGPSPFLVFAATLPATLLAVLVVLVPFGVGPTVEIGPLPTLLSVVATALVYAAYVRLLVVGTGALSWAEMGFARPAGAAVRDLAWGAALGLPVLGVTLVVAGVLVVLLGVQPDSPLPPAGDTPGLLLNLAAAGIVAPIGEEIFFRAFATSAWARVIGGQRAIVRSAVFFALVHVLTVGDETFGIAVREAAVAFVTRLPVGVALGWVFLSRGSIYASIGLHAAFNTSAILIAEAAGSFGPPA